MNIYKYPINIEDYSIVMLPYDFRIVHIAEQDGELFLWAEVVPDNYEIEVLFRIYGTGHELDKDHSRYTFVNTIVTSGGLVWHIYLIS